MEESWTTISISPYKNTFYPASCKELLVCHWNRVSKTVLKKIFQNQCIYFIDFIYFCYFLFSFFSVSYCAKEVPIKSMCVCWMCNNFCNFCWTSVFFCYVFPISLFFSSDVQAYPQKVTPFFCLLEILTTLRGFTLICRFVVLVKKSLTRTHSPLSHNKI